MSSSHSEYKGKEMTEYSVGKKIVVNIKGTWKLAEVTGPATTTGKKMSIEVKVHGSTTPENIEIDGDAPRIVSLKDFTDPEKGEVKITDTAVAKDGSVEYTIQYGGETYEGVREDILKLWQEGAKLGTDLKSARAELESGSAKKHLQFVEQNKAAEKIIAEISALIRDAKHFNTFDKSQVEERQKKLSKLIQDANKAIKTLKDEMSLIDSDADVESGKEAAEAHKLKQMIEKAINDALESTKNKNRVAAIQKAQEEYTKEKKKYDDWVAAGSVKPKKGVEPKDPGTFDASAVKVPAVTAEQFAQAKKTVYQNFLENPSKSEFEKKVLKEAERLRKDRAKKDKLADQNELEKIGGVVTDYKKPTDKAAYTASKYFDVTRETLDQVLDSFSKEDMRDFDARIADIEARADVLLSELPKEVDYTALETELNVIKTKIANDKISKKGRKLNRGAENTIIDTRINQLDKWERDFRALLSDKEVKKHAKEKQGDFAREDKAHIPVVNVPEQLMREMLKDREEVKEAVEALFTKDLHSPTEKAAALEKFKDIFGEKPPSAELLEKLKKCGIKDWEHFKELWDEELAGEALEVMHEMAKAMLKKEIAANIGFWEKAWKFKGQVLTRAALNALMVGAPAALLATVVASGGASGVIVAVMGGAAGGALKGFASEKIGKGLEKRNETLNDELKEHNKDLSISKLVDTIVAGIDGASLGKKQKTKSGDMPSFAGVLSQTLRDITTEKNKISSTEAKEAKGLKGNARILYENVLAHLDTQSLEEDVKNELARVIVKLNGKGDLEAHLAEKKMDPKVKGALDKAFAAYSGKDGWKKSALIGGAVGAAFFAGEGTARAAFGGLLGGYAGFKEGAKWDIKAEQNSAREKAFKDIQALREFAEAKARGEEVDFHHYHESLIRLKRLLHVSPDASQKELAIFGIVGKEKKAEEDHGHGGGHGHGKKHGGHGGHGGHGKKHGHGGGHGKKDAHGDHDDHSHGHERSAWVDIAGNIIVDKEGNLVDPELRFLFQDMRSAVIDAEQHGLLQEQEEDRQKLEKVMEQLKHNGQEIEHAHPHRGILNAIKKGAGWAWKHKYAAFGAVVGAALGAGVAYGGRKVVEEIRGDSSATQAGRWTRESLPQSLADHPTPLPTEGNRMPTAPEAVGAAAGARTMQPEMNTAPREMYIEEHNTQSVYTEKIGKGEGVLHAANRAIDRAMNEGKFKIENNTDADITDRELRDWKINELKKMGFVFEKGKWGYPFTVHKGAEVEVYTDDKGNAHLRVIGDEKELTRHEYIKFKDARGSVTPEQQQEIERSQRVAQRFAEEVEEFSKPDAPAHVGIHVDDELALKIGVNNDHMEGIVGAKALPNGGVSLELESGRMIGAYASPDRNFELGTDLDPNTSYWTLKPIEYAPSNGLPDEMIVQKGKVGMTDSTLEVDKELQQRTKSVMSREEYQKMIQGSGSETRRAVEQDIKPKQVADAASTETKKEVKTETAEAVGLSVEQKHNAFKNELMQMSRTIKENLKLVSNPDKVWPGIESTISEFRNAIGSNTKFDELPTGEEFGELVKDLSHPDVRLLSTPFDSAKTYDFSNGNVEGKAMIADGVADDGEQLSSIRLRVGEGSSAQDYIFSAPRGYRFEGGPGGVMLVNIQTGQPAEFQFGGPSKELSKADLILAERRAGM